MNGKYLNVERLYSELLALPIGQEVSFTAVIEHEKREIKLKIAQRPNNPPRLNEDPRPGRDIAAVSKTPGTSSQNAPFGLVVAKTDDHACEQAKLPRGCAGVAVNQVGYDSPAEDKELSGAIITAVDGIAVNSPEAYYATVGKKKSIRLTVTLPDLGVKTITLP
jgi:hypothetical protein